MLPFQFISGVGVHWYEDMLENANVSLGVTHEAFPDKFILGTEGLLAWQYFTSSYSNYLVNFYPFPHISNSCHSVTHSLTACTGADPAFHVGPVLGDWGRGVEYAYDIIQDLQVATMIPNFFLIPRRTGLLDGLIGL